MAKCLVSPDATRHSSGKGTARSGSLVSSPGLHLSFQSLGLFICKLRACLFILHIFIEDSLYVGNYVKYRKYNNEQDKYKACSYDAYSPAAQTRHQSYSRIRI